MNSVLPIFRQTLVLSLCLSLVCNTSSASESSVRNSVSDLQFHKTIRKFKNGRSIGAIAKDIRPLMFESDYKYFSAKIKGLESQAVRMTKVRKNTGLLRIGKHSTSIAVNSGELFVNRKKIEASPQIRLKKIIADLRAVLPKSKRSADVGGSRIFYSTANAEEDEDGATEMFLLAVAAFLLSLWVNGKCADEIYLSDKCIHDLEGNPYLKCMASTSRTTRTCHQEAGNGLNLENQSSIQKHSEELIELSKKGSSCSNYRAKLERCIGVFSDPSSLRENKDELRLSTPPIGFGGKPRGQEVTN